MKNRSFSGFTLVELMVAMAIGTIAVLAVMQTLSVFEGQKRTTTGGNDALSSAAMSLFTIERDARMAGYGIASSTDTAGIIARCTTNNVKLYNSGRSPAQFTLERDAFAPVSINPKDLANALIYPAGDSNTDVVQITYSGTFGMITAGTTVGVANGPTVTVSDPLELSGYRVGDLALLVPNVAGKSCIVVEITNLPTGNPCGTGVVNNQLNAPSSTSYNSYYAKSDCTAATGSMWNIAGGNVGTLTGTDAADYTNGRIFSLGAPQGFITRVFAVRNQRLTVCNPLYAPCTDTTKKNDTSVWLPVGDDIVSLRAQYGRDTLVAKKVDTWDQTTPSSLAEWQNLLAVRLTVVSRSKQYEKEEITSATSHYLKSSYFTSIDVSAVPDWKHYRYKVLETTVPLRNLIWAQPT